LKYPDDFKTLRSQWYDRLKQEGFVDVESSRGNLKQYDRRVIKFEDRDQIAQFFNFILQYIQENDLNEEDKRILEMHALGHYHTEISKQTGIQLWKVKMIIKNYKTLILPLYLKESND